jgi:hypothetical protein
MKDEENKCKKETGIARHDTSRLLYCLLSIIHIYISNYKVYIFLPAEAFCKHLVISKYKVCTWATTLEILLNILKLKISVLSFICEKKYELIEKMKG